MVSVIFSQWDCMQRSYFQVLPKGGGQKKRFQYSLNPNCLHQLLYLRAIQGHSGSTINLHCKTLYCYQKFLTEYIYHLGNGKELRSTVNGLIPGRVSLKTSRPAVFFTLVNPMDNQDGSGETYATCHKQESRQTKTWKRFQKTVFWCNLKVAQQRGLQFYHTRSNAVHTACRVTEKAICMKNKGQLHLWESVILRPRVVLEAYSQSGSQELPLQEARTSWKSQQDAESFGETRSNTADDRIPCGSISTVKLQDARSQDNVTRCSKKNVREATPIQEERESVKPAAKARPILEPSSTSKWYFIPMAQRQWIDIEVERSMDPSCFQMSKNITQLLRHKEVGREGYASSL